MQRLILRHGDCVEVLKGYEDGSIGAVVSDPPYGLKFMGMGWDSLDGRGKSGATEVDRSRSFDRIGGNHNPTSAPDAARTRRIENQKQQRWHDAWLTEVYRVLRPGGVIKAFSGTRTYHRMAAAMAEAGFVDLRIESWNYGNGFPKSHNVGKAIDALLLTGASHSTNIKAVNALRPGEGVLAGPLPNNGIMSKDPRAGSVTNDNPATEAARHWNGWGTALKPAWEPVIVGRKPE